MEVLELLPTVRSRAAPSKKAVLQPLFNEISIFPMESLICLTGKNENRDFHKNYAKFINKGWRAYRFLILPSVRANFQIIRLATVFI